MAAPLAPPSPQPLKDSQACGPRGKTGGAFLGQACATLAAAAAAAGSALAAGRRGQDSAIWNAYAPCPNGSAWASPAGTPAEAAGPGAGIGGTAAVVGIGAVAVAVGAAWRSGALQRSWVRLSEPHDGPPAPAP